MNLTGEQIRAMSDCSLDIETLWGEVDFTPNQSQRDAILHAEGPLFLTAGPGSGKTRVLAASVKGAEAF